MFPHLSGWEEDDANHVAQGGVAASQAGEAKGVEVQQQDGKPAWKGNGNGRWCQ